METMDGDDEVCPPLPVKGETLYDDPMQMSNASSNFEKEMRRPGIWESAIESSSQDNLPSLFRPPFHLIFNGPFHESKIAASIENKWLLVNIQSTKEFSSHMLNRDTWANEAVSQTIRINFIFWQVYDDTTEGKKVCTYYRLDSIPVVFVIDPITGQKMRIWSGMVRPETLFEGLLPFLDAGPKNHHSTLSLHSLKIKDDESNKEDANMLRYPPLPEEPNKGDKNILCRVGVRLPDGRRVQRSFLPTDPIQLLWSFCSAQLVGEDEIMKPFRLILSIPGAPNMVLDYESNVTLEKSGLANSMILMIWE